MLTNHHIGKEDLIFILLIRNRIFVDSAAAVISIYSKVDGLTPHTLVRVVNVEANTTVDYLWRSIFCSMPKFKAVWFYASCHPFHIYDLILVF